MSGSAEGYSSEDLIHSDMTEPLNSIAPALHSSTRIPQQSAGIKRIMVPVNLGSEEDTSENEGEHTAIRTTTISALAQDTAVGRPVSTNIQASNGQKSARRQPMDSNRAKRTSATKVSIESQAAPAPNTQQKRSQTPHPSNRGVDITPVIRSAGSEATESGIAQTSSATRKRFVDRAKSTNTARTANVTKSEMNSGMSTQGVYIGMELFH